jgi:hypothetical protein
VTLLRLRGVFWCVRVKVVMLMHGAPRPGSMSYVGSSTATQASERWLRIVSPRPLAVRAGWVTGIALLVVGTVVGCGTNESGWPHPPRQAPVREQVFVSADGRVITAKGVLACGHRPLLVARSYSNRVTLTWVNPDTSCTSETIHPVWVSMTLPKPLDSRALVQASTGKPIAYKHRN